MRPFTKRTKRFHGISTVDHWRLKRYSITHDQTESGTSYKRSESFKLAWSMVVAALPMPARTPERPGVGFVIEHNGADADYVVLAWWDRENELPLRVYVRERSIGANWRPASGSESVCVWDLEVIGYERDVYVLTLLAGDSTVDAAQRYLDAALPSAELAIELKT